LEYDNWKPYTSPLPVENFSEIIARYPVVAVVHFWAVWDRLDRRLDAILQEVHPEFDGEITFFSVDVDDEANHQLCRHVNLLNIPALVCFLHGAWHETWIGVRSAEQHQEKFRQWCSTAQHQ